MPNYKHKYKSSSQSIRKIMVGYSLGSFYHVLVKIDGKSALIKFENVTFDKSL